MPNPLNSVVSLGRLPERLIDDLDAIAEAVRRVPPIEQALASLRPQIEAATTDVRRVRETVEPQQERVAHIEDMVEDMHARLEAMEGALSRLLSMAEGAVELLPDPDDDRGPIAKARDAITGD